MCMKNKLLVVLLSMLIIGCKKDSSISSDVNSIANTNPPWTSLTSVKTYVKQDSGSWIDLAIGYPDMTQSIRISITGSGKNTNAVYVYSYHSISNYASNPDRTHYFKSIKYTEDLSNNSEKIATVNFAGESEGTSIYTFDVYYLTSEEKLNFAKFGANIKLVQNYTIYYCNISGNPLEISTMATLPILTTSVVSSIKATTAVCIGNLKNDAGSIITASGVCWSTSPNPTTSNSKTIDGVQLGTFTSSITNLSAKTTYFVRAYATNAKGTGYGNEVSFSTLNGLVNLTTNDISFNSLTSTSVSAGGNITNDGGGNIVSRGVCWSITSNPTIANNKTIDGSGIGSFTSALNGLTGNTTYYLRAYATNGVGTFYGNQITFTTKPAVLPTLTTSDAILLTFTSSTSGGSITNDGGATVTSRGVCWSTSPNPTISNNKSIDGNSIGAFISSITDLKMNSTYYIRAYATNSAGTSYGNQVTLTVGIGGRYQGGIIAYFFQTGDQGYIAGQLHGLIATSEDVYYPPSFYYYFGSNTITGATGTAIGTGIDNTKKIVTVYGIYDYAAKICNDLVLGNYTDWYLPSKDELLKLFLNRKIIGGFDGTTYYWSSSESDASHAWCMYFNPALSDNTSPSITIKSASLKVRAVRNF